METAILPDVEVLGPLGIPLEGTDLTDAPREFLTSDAPTQAEIVEGTCNI